MNPALAALSLGIAVWLLLFVMAGTPPGVQAANKTARKTASESDGDTLQQAIHSTRCWGIVGILFLVSAAGLGAVVHTAAFLTDNSIPLDMAAKSVALSGLGFVVGRLIAGGLMDKYSAARVGATAFFVGRQRPVNHGERIAHAGSHADADADADAGRIFWPALELAPKEISSLSSFAAILKYVLLEPFTENFLKFIPLAVWQAPSHSA